MFLYASIAFGLLESLGLAAAVLADTFPQRFGYLGWVWYVAVQLVLLICTVIGVVLLLPFCLAHAWRPAVSIKDKRPIDCWSFLLLNYIYANPEDGVSGQYALVWVNGAQVPYMSQPYETRADGVQYRIVWQMWLFDAWRAYCWSAWRNSCDALKYWFHWDRGPQAQVWGRKLGWWPENGYKVPLL